VRLPLVIFNNNIPFKFLGIEEIKGDWMGSQTFLPLENKRFRDEYRLFYRFRLEQLFGLAHQIETARNAN
jgi:hypothetical protein